MPKVKVIERLIDNVCDLSLCGIHEVPVREIAVYKRVTELDLSSNCITLLGKNFMTLTRLVKIDLSKNHIRFLPEDFGLLINLRHLDLYDNKLSHLPLSFGNLANLRYLDLKGNPLIPVLAKVVGFCLTTRECQDAARNTVKFMKFMQGEAEKTKEKRKVEDLIADTFDSDDIETEEKPFENTKSKKSAAKKPKSKSKKSATSNNNNDLSNEAKIAPTIVNNKATKAKKHANGAARKSITKSSTALATVFTFFILLAINVVVIYLIMFKNPEIADRLVEFIPHQYRNWILTKTEIFRLHVTEWISEFRTPPQEY